MVVHTNTLFYSTMNTFTLIQKGGKNDIIQAWISGSVVKSVHMALAEECRSYQTCGVSHYHQ